MAGYRSALLLALPVFKSLADTPLWKQEYNKAFMDSMATFKFLGYTGDYTPAAGEIYNLRLINAMFEDIIGNKVPVEKAMANFASLKQSRLLSKQPPNILLSKTIRSCLLRRLRVAFPVQIKSSVEGHHFAD